MKRSCGILMASLALATFVGLGGCGSSKPGADEASERELQEGKDHAHEDEHPHEGPHHGHLIELGDEEYHAELTHDETTKTVAVYLLDKKATSAVSIEDAEITLNLVIDGAPTPVKLAADPQDGDPEGQSSRFSIVDESVLEALEAESTAGRLNVTIDGKPYIGKIEHHEHSEHEHEEHGHEDE